MVDKLLKDFNVIISKKKDRNAIIQDIENLYKIIYKLDENNYKLTVKDWDMVMGFLCYGKCRSFLNKPYIFLPDEKYKEILNFIFSRFHPNEKQFKTIIKSGIKNNYWFDVLLKNKYPFTDNQKLLLQNENYNILKFFEDKIVHIEELKEVIKLFNNHDCVKQWQDSFKSILKINKDINLPEDFLEYVLENNPSAIYYFVKDGRVDKKDMEMCYLTKPLIPTDNCANIIAQKHVQIIDYAMEFLLDNGLKPNYELMKVYSQTTHSKYMIIKIMRKGVNLTTEIMNNILKDLSKKPYIGNYFYYHCMDYGNNKKFLNLNDDDERKVVVDKHKHNLCLLPLFDWYKLLKVYSIIPDFESLKIVCEKGFVDYFDDIVQNFDIKPDKDCLRYAIKNNNNELIEKILQFKVHPDKDCFLDGIKAGVSIEVYELLFLYGYKLTLNDMMSVCRNKIPIINLERFDISYDEQLYFICYTYNHFPQEYLDKMYKVIDTKILKLREICGNKDTTPQDVIIYMKENKVKIDRYCLDLAFSINNELGFYFLDKLKCEPTPNTMFSARSLKSLNDIQIIEKFNFKNNINSEYMAKSYNLDNF